MIVGRGSQHHLRDREDTLRIFLYAPREIKIQRLQADGVSEVEAHELIDTVDAERGDFVEKYFHMEWPNPPVYHAMLNTVAGEEVVIDTILGLRRRLEEEFPPVQTGGRSTHERTPTKILGSFPGTSVCSLLCSRLGLAAGAD